MHKSSEWSIASQLYIGISSYSQLSCCQLSCCYWPTWHFNFVQWLTQENRNRQGHRYLATYDTQITKTTTEFGATNQIVKMEVDKSLNTMRFEKKKKIYHLSVQSKGHSPLRDTQKPIYMPQSCLQVYNSIMFLDTPYVCVVTRYLRTHNHTLNFGAINNVLQALVIYMLMHAANAHAANMG